MSEEETIARLTARMGSGSRIGDDSAWLGERWPNGLAATVDSHVQGIHFRSESLPPSRVARRLVAVNVSDLAANAARPRFGLLALTSPSGFDVDVFLAATAESLEDFGAELVGGDLSRGRDLVASLTLLGEPVRRGPLLTRGSAKAGDTLWVGGTLGEAALGLELANRGATWPEEDADPRLPPGSPTALDQVATAALRRHWLPAPQLDLGHALASLDRAAAIDISDGLAKDARRLAAANSLGLTIDRSALPLAPGAIQLAKHLELDAYDLALAGGEDYVLLVATAADLSSLGMTAVGALHREPGAWLRDHEGRLKALSARGWDHVDAPGGRYL